MWLEICRFEIRYHLQRPLFTFASLVLFLFAFLMISTDAGVVVSSAPETANRNAPIVVIELLQALSLLGLFVITAFVASSAQRDFELGTHMLFFSRPIRKFDYLIGRFAGSMVVSVLLFALASLGMVAGGFAPWQDPVRLGAFTAGPFVYGFLVLLVPNLLVMGMIFFALTIWTRRLFLAYLAVVVFWFVQDAAETFVARLESAYLASLFEPMGFAALDRITRYWTVTEFNSLIPDLTGGLVHNRLLWLGVGALILLASYARFSYTRAAGRRRGTRRIAKKAAVESAGGSVPAAEPVVPATTPEASAPLPAAVTRAATDFSGPSRRRQLFRQTWLDMSFVVQSTVFLILLTLGVLFVLTTAYYIGERYGTTLLPATHVMLRSIRVTLAMILTIIVVFYSGELVWRERSLAVAEVHDALPIPNWIRLAAKMLTLCLVVGVFIATGMLATLAFQLISGYHRLELSLYARGVLLISLPFILTAALALFFQVVANNKFMGFLLTVIALVAAFALPSLGVQHWLLRFPGQSGIPYSDMNGFGHHLTPYLWVKLYWGFIAAALLILASLLWVRGRETSVRQRLAIFRARRRGPVRWGLALAAAGVLLSGATVFYNTNILNDYHPSRDADAWRARYEKSYSRYRDLPQPRVTAVTTEVDIFPRERRVEIRGVYHLVNRTGVVIDTLHVLTDPETRINRLDPGAHQPAVTDEALGYRMLALNEPLAPGEGRDLSFDITVHYRGFVNHDANNRVVRNGTFFDNGDYFPTIGYVAELQLSDPNKRRKHELPPAPRMADLDDLAARGNNYISTDADWIDFEAVVSTDPDQIAIAPGYLQKEWEEDGRRYFHYQMDAPILNFYAFLSADYTVARDRWNDVAIEVFHHEPHDTNVEHMIRAVKRSLDYYTAHFGPYQHRQVRILEFPNYAKFAQAFPNTIPFSEDIGFITRIRPEKGIDYVFVTTAHEMAHQWWAHQVIGGAVQGSTLLSESLAEYSALMVVEKEYGPDHIRRMLKHELDGYLKGRGGEAREERPMLRVENQRYLHYNKGCMVMYALRDYLGEAAVNRALARYLRLVGFQDPPYTNARELMACFREETPDSLAYLLEDMFETITLFSNRAHRATYTETEDGRYQVDLVVDAQKLRADGRGTESEIPVDDWIDVGVFGEPDTSEAAEPRVLYMAKRHITEPRTTISVVVDDPPVRAGIDPYHRLIDRDSNDNVRKVKHVDH